MTVQDVFHIRGRGIVATGQVEAGALRVGDTVQISNGPEADVVGIEVFRKAIEEANVGDNIGVMLRGVDKSQLVTGAVLTSPGGYSGLDSVAFVT